MSTLDELRDVLLRAKFERYQAIEVRRRYLDFFMGYLEPISVFTKVRECRHSKDDKFLELAVDGHAGLIVTGDKDLLALHPFRGIAIVTPAHYLAR